MTAQIAFLGTPDFAIPTLRRLAQSYPIAGVITQPDRPGGRGRKLVPPPVKQEAVKLGLEIYQTPQINSEDAQEVLQSWHPDLICVAAFGQILGTAVLNLPAYGCLNVHASLLPRWRGAAPINAAILAGDDASGVTIMKMGPGLDDGPILAQERIPISPEETAGALSDKLASQGADLLLKTIPLYLEGKITSVPQDESQATYARTLKKIDGRLDFQQEAQYLARKVRAFSPWPGSFTTWQGSRLLIHRASARGSISPGPGVFCTHEGWPAIGTASGLLILEELQLAGKSRLSGKDFLHGIPTWGSAEASQE